MWDEKLTFSGHATQNIQNALGRLIRGLYKVRIWLPEPPLSSSLSKLLFIQSFNPAIPVNGNSILFSIWVSTCRYVANFLPLDQLWRILTCGNAHKDNQTSNRCNFSIGLRSKVMAFTSYHLFQRSFKWYVIWSGFTLEMLSHTPTPPIFKGCA